MCEPTTIAMIGMAVLSAASTGMSVMNARSTAKGQMKSAAEAASLDQKALAAQQGEENDAIRLQQFERQRQGMKEQSSLAVALGEANMVGNTPFMEMSDVMAQTDYDMSIMESNRGKSEAQNGRNQQKVFSTANGRINEARAGAGNAISNGLAIVASGASGAASGYSAGSAYQGLQSAPKTT